MGNKLKVLYIDTLDNINFLLQTILKERRSDLVVLTASNKDEALRIASEQKEIDVIVLTKAVYKHKKIIKELRAKLKNHPEFLGVSSSPEILNCLGAMGCNLVFENKDDILKHIPKQHPDDDDQADQ